LRKKIRIGTRGSALAVWQAAGIKAEIEKKHSDVAIDIVIIKTTGDKILDAPLHTIGGKGLFTKEIEEALLSQEIDLAVHSMKDVPTKFPDGLHLGAVTLREDPRDVLLSRNGVRFNDLSLNAKIGTSSLRRQALLRHQRSDLVVEQVRGNVDTRIRKLKEGRFDAIVLAAAGVKRLGFEEYITEYLPLTWCIPAVGQGALGIECRKNDSEINNVISFLNDPVSRACVTAERALLQRLEGGCQVPIGCYGRIESETLYVAGMVGSIDGHRLIRDSVQGSAERAEELGTTLGEKLLSHGADVILREIFMQGSPDRAGNSLDE